METVPGSRPKVMPVTEDKGPGRIFHGPYPIDYGGAVEMLWFAFFGGNHVLEETSTFKDQLFPAKSHADLIAVDSSDISLRAECEIRRNRNGTG